MLLSTHTTNTSRGRLSTVTVQLRKDEMDEFYRSKRILEEEKVTRDRKEKEKADAFQERNERKKRIKVHITFCVYFYLPNFYVINQFLLKIYLN